MATGDTLVCFLARDYEPPVANFAQIDTRNSIPVLDFADGVDEITEFADILARHYDGGGLTVRLIWMATTATTGNVKWNVAFKSVTDDLDDLDTKAFAAAQTATTACASVSGEIQETDIAFTDGAQMDSIMAGEYFRLQVTRDADDGADTMSGDAELLAIEIRET